MSVEVETDSRVGPSKLEQLERYFVPPSIAASPEALRRAQVVLRLSLIIIVFAPLFIALAFFFYAAPLPGIVSIAVSVLAAATPFVLRRTESLPIASGLLTLSATFTIVASVASVEGLTSPALPWLAFIPMVAAASGGRRAGVVWMLACVAAVAALSVATMFEVLPSQEMTLDRRQSAAAWNTLLLVVMIGSFSIIYEGMRRTALDSLESAYRELDAARKRQMMADRLASLGTLAAGVGHEVNNPLTYVLGNLRELERELRAHDASPSKEKLAEYKVLVDESIAGATRVGEIVGDLRAFARADDDAPAPTDVIATVNAAMRITAAQWRGKVRMSVEPEGVPTVVGNASKLVQVFVNLITNAIAAMPERPSDMNEIRIRARVAGERVEVRIEDNGLGMSPQIMGRIFEPFFTTKPVGTGTGLGLSMSLSSVQAMGGRFEVESTPSRGSAFTISLAVSGEPIPRPELASAKPSGERTIEDERILVVDDEPLVARAASRLLKRRGVIVTEQSAESALARLDAERFDWILCDIMLPGMNGQELHAALRAVRPELADRVAFMSGGAISPEGARFIEEMKDRYVEKPFAPGALEALADRMGALARGDLTRAAAPRASQE